MSAVSAEQVSGHGPTPATSYCLHSSRILRICAQALGCASYAATDWTRTLPPINHWPLTMACPQPLLPLNKKSPSKGLLFIRDQLHINLQSTLAHSQQASPTQLSFPAPLSVAE